MLTPDRRAELENLLHEAEALVPTRTNMRDLERMQKLVRKLRRMLGMPALTPRRRMAEGSY